MNSVESSCFSKWFHFGLFLGAITGRHVPLGGAESSYVAIKVVYKWRDVFVCLPSLVADSLLLTSSYGKSFCYYTMLFFDFQQPGPFSLDKLQLYLSCVSSDS